MGNRQWPDEPEVHRRDDTAGWKVVGRARGGAPAQRVWQGQVPTGQPPPQPPQQGQWPAPQPPHAEQWSTPQPPASGYGDPAPAASVHPSWSAPPPYEQYQPYQQPTHYQQPGYGQYDQPTGQFPVPAYPDPPPPPYPAPAAYAGAAPPRSRARTARGGAADEPLRDPGAAWPPVMAWTVGFFVVPMLVYLAWAWTRSGAVPASCLDLGGPCVSPRTAALSDFVDALPGIAGAVTLSLLAAVGLRQLSETWRPITVGLGGAVIGAGIATLVASSF